ncbi:MAG: excisionase [Nocardioidaceae bacterium]
MAELSEHPWELSSSFINTIVGTIYALHSAGTGPVRTTAEQALRLRAQDVRDRVSSLSTEIVP